MGSGLLASARLQLLYNIVVAVLSVELKLSDAKSIMFYDFLNFLKM